MIGLFFVLLKTQRTSTITNEREVAGKRMKRFGNPYYHQLIVK
ncbi:hypothetical protein HMPREF3226_02733 [Prevotella corporis]|uniref:Uncharacterized protein n=1 Tax=Prevotella corporis TaxID=28128 RepID=A0A133PTV6_9BACT|nr:hypothetical protein HMPREF3226_02733 [Prevotella corporis]